jgi:peptide/nickel transport system substrate-binding protein
MKIKKFTAWSVVLTLMVGLLAACGPTAEPTATQVVTAPTEAPEAATTAPEPTPEPPTAVPEKVIEELVLAQRADTATLDGQLSWSMIDRNIYRQLFGYLTRNNEKMEVMPELAESWEWIDDLTFRWHLRQGVKFHNGEPFNAEAMKYSLERILDEETEAQWRTVLKFIDEIKVVDEYTVDVIATFPTTGQLLEVGRMPMVPPKYLEEVGAAEFAEHPVSAGPWKFSEWSKGDRVVLERYDDYWQGPHPVKQLVYRVVPEATTALAELLAGTVDIASISADACETVDASDMAHCVSARSIQSARLEFLQGTEDINVRKAIAHALNVDSIIENIMGGQAVPCKGAMSSLVWGASTDLAGYEYDPELSKQLLADAGYEEGELTMPLYFIEGRYPRWRELAEAIAGDIEQVGINVELQPLEYGIWMDDYYGGEMDGMTLASLTATTGDPNQVFRNYLSDTGVGYHLSDELDSYLRPVAEVVEPEARRPLVRAAEQYILDQALWICVLDVNLVYGVSNKVDWNPLPNDIKWLYSATPRD